MTKDLQGSSHHLKVVGGAYGKRKDFIYEYQRNRPVSRRVPGNRFPLFKRGLCQCGEA